MHVILFLVVSIIIFTSEPIAVAEESKPEFKPIIQLRPLYPQGRESIPKDSIQYKCYLAVNDSEEQGVRDFCFPDAEKGNPISQYNLAFAHYYGQGVEKDIRKAIGYLFDAKKQGNTRADLLLGHFFIEDHAGTRFGADSFCVPATVGVSAYTDAREEGDTMAFMAFSSGFLGIIKKFEEMDNGDCMLKVATMAALQGWPTAQIILADMLYNLSAMLPDEKSKNELISQSYAMNQMFESNKYKDKTHMSGFFNIQKVYGEKRDYSKKQIAEASKHLAKFEEQARKLEELRVLQRKTEMNR